MERKGAVFHSVNSGLFSVIECSVDRIPLRACLHGRIYQIQVDNVLSEGTDIQHKIVIFNIEEIENTDQKDDLPLWEVHIKKNNFTNTSVALAERSNSSCDLDCSLRSRVQIPERDGEQNIHHIVCVYS